MTQICQKIVDMICSFSQTEGVGALGFRKRGKPGRGEKVDKQPKKPYEKPELVKHLNLKDITFECSGWSCSVTVPPAP